MSIEAESEPIIAESPTQIEAFAVYACLDGTFTSATLGGMERINKAMHALTINGVPLVAAEGAGYQQIPLSGIYKPEYYLAKPEEAVDVIDYVLAQMDLAESDRSYMGLILSKVGNQYRQFTQNIIGGTGNLSPDSGVKYFMKDVLIGDSPIDFLNLLGLSRCLSEPLRYGIGMESLTRVLTFNIIQRVVSQDIKYNVLSDVLLKEDDYDRSSLINTILREEVIPTLPDDLGVTKDLLEQLILDTKQELARRAEEWVPLKAGEIGTIEDLSLQILKHFRDVLILELSEGNYDVIVGYAPTVAELSHLYFTHSVIFPEARMKLNRLKRKILESQSQL